MKGSRRSIKGLTNNGLRWFSRSYQQRLKLRYSNFEPYTKQLTIPYTNADHVLLKTATGFFEKLYERRMLIRLVGIRFTNLIPGNYKISLFDDTQESVKLYQAIDSIKKQYGEKFVMRAVGV